MRIVEGKTDRVVIVGAGLSGLSAALYLAGRGRNVTVVERGAVPGGRVGRADISGYRLDTGPTVLTMPDIIDDALSAVGETLTDRLELLPVHPAYRAMFADGNTLEVHTEADAMFAEIERFSGSAGSRRLPASACLADRAVPHRVRRVHRRQLRFAAVPGDPAAGPAGGAGRVPALGQGDAPIPQRRTAASGVHLSGAVCGRSAAERAGGLRGDRLHGHHCRRVLPTWRDAGSARRDGGRRS